MVMIMKQTNKAKQSTYSTIHRRDRRVIVCQTNTFTLWQCFPTNSKRTQIHVSINTRERKSKKETEEKVVGRHRNRLTLLTRDLVVVVADLIDKIRGNPSRRNKLMRNEKT